MDSNPFSPVPVNPSSNALEPITPIEQARQLIVKDDRAGAVQVLETTIQQDPYNIDVLWTYAQITPDTSRAMKALERILSIQPTHVEAKMLMERLKILSIPNNPALPSQADLMQQMLLQQQMLLHQQMLAQQRQPQSVINIDNRNNINTGQPVPPPMLVDTYNETAFWAGILLAVFFATFGIGHMMNDKFGTGISLMLLGWLVWVPILVLGIISIVGIFIVGPLHILFAYLSARDGAQSREIVMAGMRR